MVNSSDILIFTSASIAFVHTILGPDHYIPFIAMSKAGEWSKEKTIKVTFFSGLGHVLSSVLIGVVGIIAGTALNQLEYLESIRGDIAAWLLISFGFIYFVWGLKKLYSEQQHVHIHKHEDGRIHFHSHNHKTEHAHIHIFKRFSPWAIFTIFILGPCEPLIPLIIFPAVSSDILLTISVIIIFTLVTTGTMLLIVIAGLRGLKFFEFKKVEKYSFSFTGLIILFCGIAIKFLGL